MSVDCTVHLTHILWLVAWCRTSKLDRHFQECFCKSIGIISLTILEWEPFYLLANGLLAAVNYYYLIHSDKFVGWEKANCLLTLTMQDLDISEILAAVKAKGPLPEMEFIKLSADNVHDERGKRFLCNVIRAPRL